MSGTMARTYTRRRETKGQELCRYAKRRIRKFLIRNMPRIIFFGLPAIGMVLGVFIGVKATAYAYSMKINDYGRKMVYTTYVVRSGDTVWGIASDLAALNPEYNDIRQYVAAIKKANGLLEGDIESGQVILIPYYINMDGTLDYGEIYSRYGIGK